MSLALPTTVTNGNFETRLSGFTLAPFTAITRTGDVANAKPNSHLPVLCTSALGVEFYISYDQLGDAAIARDVIRQAHEEITIGLDLAALVQGLSNLLTTTHAPGLGKDGIVAILRAFASVPQLTGHLPMRAWDEAESHPLPTVAIAGAETDLDVAITDTSTNVDDGTATFVLWDFGDGEYSLEREVTSHSYAAEGTYTITKLVISPQGVFSDTAEVSPTDPE
jgi:hypothetical protein